MFPKHMRWIFLIAAIAGVIAVFLTGLMVYLGEPSSRMVMPIGVAICCGWASTQCTKT